LQATLQANAYLCTDQVIFSPGRVYNAVLQDDGNFVVYRGSQPFTSAPWATGRRVDLPNGYGAFFVKQQEDGNFIIVGPDNPNAVFYKTNTEQSTKGDYFAALADNGAFTINVGTPSRTGRRLFNNGIDDPVDSINLTNINYDLDNQTVSPPTSISGASLACNNTTSSVTVQCSLMLSLSYTVTNTSSFSASTSITLGIKTTTRSACPS
jgi:hypothetical protein